MYIYQLAIIFEYVHTYENQERTFLSVYVLETDIKKPDWR